MHCRIKISGKVLAMSNIITQYSGRNIKFAFLSHQIALDKKSLHFYLLEIHVCSDPSPC